MRDFEGLSVAKKELDYYQIALNHLLERGGRGTDTAVAIEIGANQSTVSRIKLGYNKGTVETREAIARALKTTYYDMMTLGKALKEGVGPEEVIEPSISYKSSLLRQAAKMMKQLDDEGNEEDAKHIFRTIEDVCKSKELDRQLAELEKLLGKNSAGGSHA